VTGKATLPSCLAFTLIAGCATASAKARPRSPEPALSLNGRRVSVTYGQSLLDVISPRVSGFRLGQHAQRQADVPLFYVDHVPVMEGIDLVARLPATDVDSVRTVLPTEAVIRFGTDGRNGAILVFTRSR